MKKVITFCVLLVCAHGVHAGTIKLTQSDFFVCNTPVITLSNPIAGQKYYWQYSDKADDVNGVVKWNTFDSTSVTIKVTELPNGERRYRVISWMPKYTSSNQVLICKCGTLATNDLSIGINRKKLLLQGTASEFYDEVQLIGSHTQRDWQKIRDVKSIDVYDFSFSPYEFYRLEGYKEGILIRSSRIVNVKNAQYTALIKKVEVYTLMGQGPVKTYTNISAVDDEALAWRIKDDIPFSPFVMRITDSKNIVHSNTFIKGN